MKKNLNKKTSIKKPQRKKSNKENSLKKLIKKTNEKNPKKITKIKTTFFPLEIQ